MYHCESEEYKVIGSARAGFACSCAAGAKQMMEDTEILINGIVHEISDTAVTGRAPLEPNEMRFF